MDVVLSCSYLRDVIFEHFWMGYKYSTIIRFLDKLHGITLSCRTLKRWVSDYELYRRDQQSPLLAVLNAIETELQGPGMFTYAILSGSECFELHLISYSF